MKDVTKAMVSLNKQVSTQPNCCLMRAVETSSMRQLLWQEKPDANRPNHRDILFSAVAKITPNFKVRLLHDEQETPKPNDPFSESFRRNISIFPKTALTTQDTFDLAFEDIEREESVKAVCYFRRYGRNMSLSATAVLCRPTHSSQSSKVPGVNYKQCRIYTSTVRNISSILPCCCRV